LSYFLKKILYLQKIVFATLIFFYFHTLLFSTETFAKDNKIRKIFIKLKLTTFINKINTVYSICSQVFLLAADLLSISGQKLLRGFGNIGSDPIIYQIKAGFLHWLCGCEKV
jgi:hypothetical protein